MLELLSFSHSLMVVFSLRDISVSPADQDEGRGCRCAQRVVVCRGHGQHADIEVGLDDTHLERRGGLLGTNEKKVKSIEQAATNLAKEVRSGLGTASSAHEKLRSEVRGSLAKSRKETEQLSAQLRQSFQPVSDGY